MDKPDELLPRVLDVVARIKIKRSSTQTKKHDFCSRVAECVEVGGGIF